MMPGMLTCRVRAVRQACSSCQACVDSQTCSHDKHVHHAKHVQNIEHFHDVKHAHYAKHVEMSSNVMIQSVSKTPSLLLNLQASQASTLVTRLVNPQVLTAEYPLHFAPASDFVNGDEGSVAGDSDAAEIRGPKTPDTTSWPFQAMGLWETQELVAQPQELVAQARCAIKQALKCTASTCMLSELSIHGTAGTQVPCANQLHTRQQTSALSGKMSVRQQPKALVRGLIGTGLVKVHAHTTGYASEHSP
eukprot:1162127-Pelagomonas_calceolata.AAC.3